MNSRVRHTSPRAPVETYSAARVHPGIHKYLSEVLKQRWRKYRKAIKRCRKDYCEDSIHQMRIETRRIVALLNLMHPFHPLGLERVQRRFKKLFKGSATVRDTQVQLIYLQKDLENYPQIRPFRKHLTTREKRLQKKFRKSVAGGLKPKLIKSMASLRRWFRSWQQKTALDESHAKKLLDGIALKYANVLKAREAVNATVPATIHRLRVAFKAYRYMVELVGPFLRGVTERHLNALREYQGIMGDIQDIEVLLGALNKFEKKHSRYALNAYRSELERRHQKLIARFLATRLPSLNSALCLGAAARNGN